MLGVNRSAVDEMKCSLSTKLIEVFLSMLCIWWLPLNPEVFCFGFIVVFSLTTYCYTLNIRLLLFKVRCWTCCSTISSAVWECLTVQCSWSTLLNIRGDAAWWKNDVFICRNDENGKQSQRFKNADPLLCLRKPGKPLKKLYFLLLKVAEYNPWKVFYSRDFSYLLKKSEERNFSH